MQITLNQEEIVDAIEDYVRSQITIADNQKIDIDFKAGRGDNGVSATLDIRPATTTKKKDKPTRSASKTEKEPEEAPVEKAPAKKESSAKTKKEEPENSAEEVEDTSQEKDETGPEPAEGGEPSDQQAEEEPKEAPAPKPGSIFTFANKSQPAAE